MFFSCFNALKISFCSQHTSNYSSYLISHPHTNLLTLASLLHSIYIYLISFCNLTSARGAPPIDVYLLAISGLTKNKAENKEKETKINL